MGVGERSGARGGSPLRRREFRLYFVGNLTSNIGSWLSNVALAVYMRELTRSSLWVGVVGLGLFAPVLLFALPAGVLADRIDRLLLLRRAQMLMAVLAIALTVLVATGQANRYVVTAISFGLGLGIAVGIPAMQALIPQLVPPEELSEAIQYNALSFNVARAVGPVVAFAALSAIGATWAFGLNAASFVPLMVALYVIRRPPFQRPAGPPGPMREGIAYAWRHLSTRWMLLSIAAIGTALDPIFTLSPALAERAGHASSSAGLIVAAWGSGAVGAILLGRRAIRAMSEHGLGWIGLLVLFVGLAGLGLGSTSFPAMIAAAIVAGVGYITATMAFTTTIQASVPEALRGRIMAMWTLAFLGPRALAAVVDGWLGDHIGAAPTTVAFGTVALAGAILLRRVQPGIGEPVPPPA